MAATNTGTSASPNSRTMPSLQLQGRVAIVTGSSRGISRAIVIHLAALGAKVVINYTSNKEQADLVADEINSASLNGGAPQAIVVQADVSDSAHVKLLFDEAETVFGSQVHIFVNSAITDTKYPTIANTSLEDFDRIFRRIVMLQRSSKPDHIAFKLIGEGMMPNNGRYTATKAAVESMMKIVSKELKGTDITANCVSPGPVATEMFFTGISEEEVKHKIEECSLGRLGETNDVAPVVGFLASDAGEWINGQVIGVNGGIFAV